MRPSGAVRTITHEVLEHRGGQLGDLPQPLVQPHVRVLGGGQQPSGLGEEPVARLRTRGSGR